MLIVKCAKCKRKIFKYLKIGKGRLLRCWKERIIKNYSVQEGIKVKCQCGNVIGIDKGRWIKMKQNAFIYSGTVIRK
ncbi:MAG: hypothetical protein LWW95_06445 [Candidatus Desulfofervidus auxilii]|nr:hypothetical protein [Candidatus Desulfofervidus auxilii]